MEKEEVKEEVKEEEVKGPKAHCLNCKTKRSIVDAVEGQTKNKHPILSGKCGTCGKKVSTFISSRKVSVESGSSDS